MLKKELVIIGGGPAGMAAAAAAYRAGVRDIMLIERNSSLGGILNQCIHPGFGLNYFKEILTGPEYAERFINKVKAISDIKVSLRTFVINLTKDKVLTYIKTGKVESIKAKTIIVSTGCRERTREMIHVPGFRPSGIFSAGLAQKLINIEGLMPGRAVVIIGSGDIGLIMARRLTLEGAKVKAVIEIMDKTKGLVRNVVQCLEDFNIPLYLRHKVKFIHGKNRVSSVDAARVDDKLKEIRGTEFSIKCDTVLVSVGLIPEVELIEEFNTKPVPGLFVCGNAFKVYDLVDSVTKDSERAGRQAADYLFKTN